MDTVTLKPAGCGAMGASAGMPGWGQMKGVRVQRVRAEELIRVWPMILMQPGVIQHYSYSYSYSTKSRTAPSMLTWSQSFIITIMVNQHIGCEHSKIRAAKSRMLHAVESDAPGVHPQTTRVRTRVACGCTMCVFLLCNTLKEPITYRGCHKSATHLFCSLYFEPFPKGLSPSFFSVT